MLDAVTTVTTQAQALRTASQPAASVISAAAGGKVNNQAFVSSTIRVDNLQNVAILEYRSEEGEVVQQYPTQAQIEAFKSAERLLAEAPRTEAPAASHEGLKVAVKVDAPDISASAPAEHHAAPAPQHTTTTVDA